MPDGSHKDMGQYHKDSITQEIFIDKCYEKFFEVEEGDIVLDIGASVGPFTYSILNKKPKHVFCFEPSESEFKTLVGNTLGYPVTQINKGISNVNSVVMNDHLFGGEDQMESITFLKFIDLYGIDKIDFLKTDCEGGEFDIFTLENLDWIKKNVKKIVGEWHLRTPEHKVAFRNFRDNILTQFDKYEVFAVDGVNIKWDLWNDHFIEYYCEVILYIDNR
jgi:FkbM family methyltransferase